MSAQSPGDAARRQELRGYLGAVASDLRQWVEWARMTGAVELPLSPTPPEPLRLSQRPNSVSTPKAAPRRAVTPTQRPAPSRAPQGQAPAGATRPPIPARAGEPSAGTGREGLSAIASDLGACTRCQLSQGRKNIVFGVGSPEAKLVVVGEAPGRNEDLTGEPFVGRAGALLNRMLEAIGLSRDAVYICNVIKCRPPQNRDPLPPEIASCSPFLHRQLDSIAPSVILTVGRFASVNIMGRDATMGELRKTTASMRGIPVVATYHPAYLLRNPSAKRKAWEDLLRARTLLRRGR